MVQRTVLKVVISCQKCKRQLLKAVSGLQGVDKIEIDVGKGTLMVTGDADPYEVIIRTRKTGKFVEVVSVGPPPKADSGGGGGGGQKKSEEKKPDQMVHHVHMPQSCPICERMAFNYLRPEDGQHLSCSIL